MSLKLLLQTLFPNAEIESFKYKMKIYLERSRREAKLPHHIIAAGHPFPPSIFIDKKKFNFFYFYFSKLFFIQVKKADGMIKLDGKLVLLWNFKIK